jgi:pimeloyl-ACP methyl ester carboxylesterase
MKRGIADTRQGQLHYHTAGDGPPLLLLHPTNLSSRFFLKVMPLLPAFRTYAPDLPGFGYSDPIRDQPDIRAFARTVSEFMDALGLQKAHVFGLHAGNKIGAVLAQYWPQRVERFMLAGMTHSLISDQSKRLASIPDYAHKLHETQKAADRGLNLKEWAIIFNNLSKIWWRPGAIGKNEVTDQDLRQLEDEVIDLLHGRQGYGAFYRASWAFDIGETLAKVTAPTLVIELATPREAHLGRQAPVLEKLMPNCRSVTVEMNDSDLLYHHPEILARHITEFLSAP